MKKEFALIAALASPAAWAGQPGYFDIFFAPSADFEVDGFGISGDGFGVKTTVPLKGKGPAFLFEYQSNSYDFGIDLDSLRGGLGVFNESGSGLYLEYAKLELDGDPAEGPGLHLRLSGHPSPNVNLYGQLGYLKLDADGTDVTGPEFLVGAAFDFDSKWGGFADYRSTRVDVEDDTGDDAELTFEDFRLGVRLKFGS